jgi:PAS domain-containing protein
MQVMSTYYWLCDGSGRLLEIDEALVGLLGYSLSQIQAVAITDIEIGLILHPRPSVWQRTARYRARDGTTLNMHCCTRHSPVDGGQYFTFVQELHSPEELSGPAASNTLLHTILDAQPSNIVLFNLQSEVLWLNRTACQSCNGNLVHLLGRKCHELWPGCRERSCGSCPVEVTIASEKIEQRKMTMPNKRRWRVTTVPIHDGRGDFKERAVCR